MGLGTYSHSDWIIKLEINDRISVAHKNGKEELKGNISARELWSLKNIPSVKNIFDCHAESAIYHLQTIFSYCKNLSAEPQTNVEEGCDDA